MQPGCYKFVPTDGAGSEFDNKLACECDRLPERGILRLISIAGSFVECSRVREALPSAERLLKALPNRRFDRLDLLVPARKNITFSCVQG